MEKSIVSTMKRPVSSIEDILQKEILWCIDNQGSVETVHGKGFLDGLKHALRLAQMDPGN